METCCVQVTKFQVYRIDLWKYTERDLLVAEYSVSIDVCFWMNLSVLYLFQIPSEKNMVIYVRFMFTNDHLNGQKFEFLFLFFVCLVACFFFFFNYVTWPIQFLFYCNPHLHFRHNGLSYNPFCPALRTLTFYCLEKLSVTNGNYFILFLG